MNERPTHMDLIQGNSLQEKIKRSFKLGYSYMIIYHYNKNESRYFVRSWAGALGCQSMLSGMGYPAQILPLKDAQ